MTMRQRRKQFWQFLTFQHFDVPVPVSIFMRSHMRRVKPEPKHRRVRNRLEKRT